MSSNWSKLKEKLAASNTSNASTGKGIKRRELSQSVNASHVTQQESDDTTTDAISKAISRRTKALRDKIVALDCEMVGIGLSGKQSVLARCSMVDYDGNVLYDKFVRPPVLVTDFRTKWSGVRKRDLRVDHSITFAECQLEVAAILKNKVLVGHALKNDLSVLMLSHSKSMIRDTATFRPYMRPHGKKGGKWKPRALRDLTKQFLGKVIQTGEHDSCEDARCSLELYKLKAEEWEKFNLEKKAERKLKMTSKHILSSEDDKVLLSEESDDIKQQDKPVSLRMSLYGDTETLKGSVTIQSIDNKTKKRKFENN